MNEHGRQVRRCARTGGGIAAVLLAATLLLGHSLWISRSGEAGAPSAPPPAGQADPEHSSRPPVPPIPAGSLPPVPPPSLPPGLASGDAAAAGAGAENRFDIRWGAP